MKKSKAFLFCLLFFILGIGVNSFLELETSLLFFGSFCFLLILSFVFWEDSKKRLVLLFCLFFFLGLWRYSINIPGKEIDKIWYYNGKKVEMIGYVCKEVDRRNDNQKIKFCVQAITGVNTEVKGMALLTLEAYPKYFYGDKMRVVGELKTPERFKDFSYDRYLARYDIYSVSYYPTVEKLGKSDLSFFQEVFSNILKFKEEIRSIFNFNLKNPEGGIAKAMILGDKSEISEDLRTRFSKVGLSHIIAISGLHIAVIISIFYVLFLNIGLNKRFSFYLIICFLFFYILLIGAPASAFRAGFMGALALLAVNLGRKRSLINILVLAASVLLFFNPNLLRDDIGFQLSFLAVLGILYFYPIFDKWLFKIKKNNFLLKVIKDVFSVTISAQILTTPVIAYNFDYLSIISPVSNLLILWILPFLIIVIFLALSLSFILPVFSVVFFIPAFIILKYIILVTDVFSSVKYFYIEVDNFNPIFFGFYFFILGCFIFWFNYKEKQKIAD